MAARFFGQYLAERGVIDTQSLRRALEYQNERNARVGDLAVRSGLLKQGDADRIAEEQRHTGAQFGDVATRLGLLDEGQVVALLARQHQERMLLGQALVAIGALDEATLERELVEYKAQQDREKDEVAGARALAPWAAELPVTTLVQITAQVLHRLADMPAKEGFARLESELPARAVRLATAIGGAWRGAFALCFTREMANRLATSMLNNWPGGLPDELVQEAIEAFGSAVGTQVATGLAAAGLPCQIDRPRLLDAGPAERFAGRQVLIVPFDSPHGSIEVAIVRD